MHVSARSDYAVRAAVELAAAGGGPLTAECIATAQHIPQKFLTAILLDLKRARLVGSQRGADGGYFLARPAAEVSIADIMRAVEGQIVHVRGNRPEDLDYSGRAEPLQAVWVAARAALRSVLETVSVADVALDQVPASVAALAEDPQAWH